MALFGQGKKDCWVLQLQSDGTLNPIPAERGEGMTVKYELRKKTHHAICGKRSLRYQGKPAWLVPEGKSEPIDLFTMDTTSLMTDLTFDEAIGNSYISQFMSWMRTASTIVAQNWIMIIIGIALIGGTIWVNNNIDHMNQTVNHVWEQVKPTPTPQPQVVQH